MTTQEIRNWIAEREGGTFDADANQWSVGDKCYRWGVHPVPDTIDEAVRRLHEMGVVWNVTRRMDCREYNAWDDDGNINVFVPITGNTPDAIRHDLFALVKACMEAQEQQQ